MDGSSYAEHELERPACPLCGAAAGAWRYAFPPFGVTCCAECATWFLAPRLREEIMRRAYASADYFEGDGFGYSSYRAQEATLRRTFRRLLRTMRQRGMSGGSVLEVGCAYGFFLDEASSYFAERVGTDYSAAAATAARATGARIVDGGLEALAPGETFDCAACIHVIEHVYDPRAFLAELHARLRPGGSVVVAAPDMGSWWRSLLGRRWPFFKVPEHVSFFDQRSLTELLRRAGFVDPAPLPYTSYFPLLLVAEKLGLGAPAALAELAIWMPATTVAVTARRP